LTPRINVLVKLLRGMQPQKPTVVAGDHERRDPVSVCSGNRNGDQLGRGRPFVVTAGLTLKIDSGLAKRAD
jgi:hypothetical protein